LQGGSGSEESDQPAPDQPAELVHRAEDSADSLPRANRIRFATGTARSKRFSTRQTVEMLIKQAEALIDKLGPEYFKLMDGLEQVDPKSSEAKEFMSILSELDKGCTK
jgi:hypothetical protein